MKFIPPRHRQPFNAFPSWRGLLAIAALCGTQYAWSQHAQIPTTSNSSLSNTPKSSVQIGGDRRNGDVASNLPATAISNLRTPMEVTSGVARLLEHYPESSKLRVIIGLTPPKMAEEEQFLKTLQYPKSPNFHKWLTAEQWNERFAPAAEDEQAVVDWAKSQGLTVTQRYPNRLIVDVEGTSGAIEKAFRVVINNYSLRGATEFSNDRDPVIPAHLANIIQSVGGLNSVQRAHSLHEGNSAQLFKSYAEGDVVSNGAAGQHDGNLEAFQEALKASDAKKEMFKSRKGAAQNGPVDPNMTSGLIDPTDIYSSYGYSYGALQNLGHCCNPTHNSGGTPANTSIAVATAYGFQGSDIVGFQSRYSYLAYHYFTINVDGTPSCCNDETTLDTEWSIATANSFGSYQDTSSVYVYQGVNNLLSTFTDVYNAILNRNETRVMTTSWGCQEFACTSSSTMDTDHAIFNSMIGQGWTLMAATGDQGAAAGCGDADAIQYPSSDPDIVAVGGTTLTLNSNGTFNSETGWQGSTFSGACSSNNGGSTGGCSGKFAAPSWQTSPFCGSTSRSVPDISLNAGAGQNTYYDGAWYGFGGTSIASPMVAGFFAQANAYLTSIGSQYTMIGQGGPKFYYFAHNPTYASHVPFYDMTSGCNNNDITAEFGLGYFCSVAGYDRVTGWGSFNALQMSWAMNAWFLGDFIAPTITFSGPSHTQGSDNWYNTDQTVSWVVNDTGSGGLASTGIAGYSAGWDVGFSDPNSEPHGGAPNSFYSGPEYPNQTTGSLDLAAAGQGCHFATVNAWDNSGYTPGDEYYYYLCYDNVAPVSKATLSGTLHGSVYDTAVKVTLTSSDATSGVANTYYSLDGAPFAAYSSPLTISSLGTHKVQHYSVDVAGNKEAIKVVSFTISSLTTTTLTSSLNPAIYGQAVSFSAKVAASMGGTPTGSVQFLQSGSVVATVALSGGKATYTTSDLSAKSHTIQAAYVGDTNDIASTSTSLAETVTQATTTTSLAASINPSAFNQAVTFTAIVNPAHGGTPTGTVTFEKSGTSIGTATVSAGKATFTTSALLVGTHTITAVYSGDTNLKGSTSSSLAEVTKAASTTTTIASSNNPSNFGEAVTLTATVTPKYGGTAGGTVTFNHGSVVLGTATLSGNVAKLTLSNLPVGSEHFTATYGGSTDYLTSTSASLEQVVDKATTTTTLASSKNPSTHGTSVTFTATVKAGSGATPTGSVTFKDGSTTLGTGSLSSGKATFSTSALATGTHSITAAYGGSSSDAASTSSTLSQKVE